MSRTAFRSDRLSRRPEGEIVSTMPSFEVAVRVKSAIARRRCSIVYAAREPSVVTYRLEAESNIDLRNLQHYDEVPERLIRYLILCPGVRDEPLICALRTSHVNDIECKAILYVWGAEMRVHYIHYDNMPVKITVTSNEAFRQVRRMSTTKPLWVDSICINQNNLKEKGYQALMTGQIWKSACRLLILVGSADSVCIPELKDLAGKMNQMIDAPLCHTFQGARSDYVTKYQSELHSDSTLRPIRQWNKASVFQEGIYSSPTRAKGILTQPRVGSAGGTCGKRVVRAWLGCS